MPCDRRFILVRIRFGNKKRKQSCRKQMKQKKISSAFYLREQRAKVHACMRIVFIKEPCESYLKKRQYYYKIKRMITYYNKE